MPKGKTATYAFKITEGWMHLRSLKNDGTFSLLMHWLDGECAHASVGIFVNLNVMHTVLLSAGKTDWHKVIWVELAFSTWSRKVSGGLNWVSEDQICKVLRQLGLWCVLWSSGIEPVLHGGHPTSQLSMMFYMFVEDHAYLVWVPIEASCIRQWSIPWSMLQCDNDDLFLLNLYFVTSDGWIHSEW